MPRPYFITWQQ